ncbi:3-dehydroquinate dehydratase [Ornithinimicrobium sp. F0845]|uniref:type II 3-dehydroquinate dehydratase n=1 Tax=Ornithinimicrobium sp. F0845 TaxID=2926412 RepID=UPI001FF48C31|nr:type II 3-dehydroquinate dehydratase [Ornithinimicrobium sp. F0845]MCK0114253.1 3-dehydroquinate dehydratase [Ornithinimicrobium sp. F0845]
MSRRVLVLSGPNLAALGSREPEIYGTLTLAQVEDRVREYAESLGLSAQCRQTDDEAELIGWLHEAAREGWDVVLNPAAFTHYSYAVGDACAHLVGMGSRLVEVHLSNPAARETFRHASVVARSATGTIAGFGADSYLLALRALAAPDS